MFSAQIIIKMTLMITVLSGLLSLAEANRAIIGMPDKTKNIIVRPDLKLDLAQGTVRFWSQGGRLVGGTSVLQIGHPNHARRGDRALIRFDLRKFIAKGKIRRARFLFTVTRIYGLAKNRELKLEYIKHECAALIHADLTSTQTVYICPLKINKPPIPVKVDVAKAVNSILAQGGGSITFRVSDPDAERLGNPDNIPTGSAISVASIRMEVNYP